MEKFLPELSRDTTEDYCIPENELNKRFWKKPLKNPFTFFL